MKKRKIITYTLTVLLIISILGICSVAIYVGGVVSKSLDLSLFTVDRAHSATKIFVMKEGEWVEWEEERVLGNYNFEFAPYPWRVF